MADPPPRSASDRVRSDGPPGVAGRDRPATPRWVKIVGVIALVLLVVVVVALVAGGGEHGPGRHSGSGDGGAQTAPSGTGERGSGRHKPPPGGH